jgi:hypothetical protein
MITAYEAMRIIPQVRVRKYPLSGTTISVAPRRRSSPQVLTRRVLPNWSVYGVAVWCIMYDPEIPTPRRIFSIGPPKQAENPMMGANT